MKYVVITPYLNGRIRDAVELLPEDYILCADTAYRAAMSEGIIPDIVIGDFDHEEAVPFHGGAVIRVPAEKDDTDTMLCVKHVLERGGESLVIVGGIGGRLDHTIANVQTLAYAASHGVNAVLTDGKNEACILTGEHAFPKRNGYYFSVFAYGASCEGVSLSGVKYPLRDARLTVDFPLGVSNEITEETARIRVKHGRLLVIQSPKEH